MTSTFVQAPQRRGLDRQRRNDVICPLPIDQLYLAKLLEDSGKEFQGVHTPEIWWQYGQLIEDIGGTPFSDAYTRMEDTSRSMSGNLIREPWHWYRRYPLIIDSHAIEGFFPDPRDAFHKWKQIYKVLLEPGGMLAISALESTLFPVENGMLLPLAGTSTEDHIDWGGKSRGRLEQIG